MDRQYIRIGDCGLCKHAFTEENVVDHFIVCIFKAFEGKRNIDIKLEEYYIQAYILDLIADFDIRVNTKHRFVRTTVWSLYEHIYLNRIGRGHLSAALNLDDFQRLVLAKVDNIQDRYLNILPDISIKDFTNRFGVINFNVLFSRSQINILKNGE
jgi:hypothetical protein